MKNFSLSRTGLVKKFIFQIEANDLVISNLIGSSERIYPKENESEHGSDSYLNMDMD